MASRPSLRPGFLLSFALLLAIGVGGLAYVVSSFVGSDIRTQQVSDAQQRAQLLASAAFAPTLRLKLHGLDAAQLRPLDAPATSSTRPTTARSDGSTCGRRRWSRPWPARPS
jgi:hypothetical protein